MTTELKKLNDREEVVLVPPVDIYENGEAYILKCEMPGVDRENIDVTLNNHELEINGRVSAEYAGDAGTVYSEYRLHNFSRKFTVDDSINTGAIQATLYNGILSITLPKSEKVKPRKIEIAMEK